jgi:lactobin A/cerein 7B family class IIb bacteriocin
MEMEYTKTLNELTLDELDNINGGDGAVVLLILGAVAVGWCAGQYLDYMHAYYKSHPAPKYINPNALVE